MSEQNAVIEKVSLADADLDALYFAAVEASYTATGGSMWDADSHETRTAHYAGLRAVANAVLGCAIAVQPQEPAMRRAAPATPPDEERALYRGALFAIGCEDEPSTFDAAIDCASEALSRGDEIARRRAASSESARDDATGAVALLSPEEPK